MCAICGIIHLDGSRNQLSQLIALGLPVPQGHTRIARRFNAGNGLVADEFRRNG